MSNNLALDYDDLDNIEPTLDMWVRQARNIGQTHRITQFENAIRGGIRKDYIDKAIELRDEIEDADTIQMIPMSDIGSVEPFFRVPLEKGIDDKVNEIRKETFEKIEGKIGTVKSKTLKKNIREKVDVGDLTSVQQKELISSIEGEVTTLYKELRDDIFNVETTAQADTLIERGREGGLSEKLISSLERSKVQQFAEV